MTFGLVKHITVEESTSIQWVNKVICQGFDKCSCTIKSSMLTFSTEDSSYFTAKALYFSAKKGQVFMYTGNPFSNLNGLLTNNVISYE